MPREAQDPIRLLQAPPKELMVELLDIQGACVCLLGGGGERHRCNAVGADAVDGVE